MEGNYRSLSVPETTGGKLVALFGYGREITVNAYPSGYIEVGGDTYTHTGELMFRETNGDEPLAFITDEENQIRAYSNGPRVFLKIRWYEARPFHLILLLVCLGIFLTAMIGWPINSLLHRLRRSQKTTLNPKSEQKARLLAGLVVLLFVFFFVLYNLPTIIKGPTSILLGMHWLAKAALVIPLLAIILSLGLVYLLFKVWITPFFGIFGRLHYTLVVMAVFAFIWFLYYWNLIGFNY